MNIGKIPPLTTLFNNAKSKVTQLSTGVNLTWITQKIENTINSWLNAIPDITWNLLTWNIITWSLSLSDKYKVSENIIGLLKDMNFTWLKTYIHPAKWVLFSPYEYIDKNRVITFSTWTITDISNDNKIYTWWTDAASWNPINLSLSGYYKKFIYDVDFSKAPVKNYWENFQRWSINNNVQQVFPNWFITEYYFTGFDVKYEWMDWRSLRLILEPLNWNWYLVWVVHWQWTP